MCSDVMVTVRVRDATSEVGCVWEGAAHKGRDLPVGLRIVQKHRGERVA